MYFTHLDIVMEARCSESIEYARIGKRVSRKDLIRLVCRENFIGYDLCALSYIND
jgi:hypothetical protein